MSEETTVFWSVPCNPNSYLTFPDSLREDAKQNVKRAKFHMDAGDLEYAWGSIRKASKKYRAATEHEAWYNSLLSRHPAVSKVYSVLYASQFELPALGLHIFGDPE